MRMAFVPFLVAASLAARAAPAAPLVASLEAGSAVDVEVSLDAIPGDLRPPGAPPERATDFADYSRAGTLVLHRAVLLGPLPGGDVLVPAGTYAAGLVPTGTGLPAFRLTGADGARVQVPLVGASPAVPRPTALATEGMPAAGGGWTLVVHLPSGSGMVRMLAARDVPPAPPSPVAAVPAVTPAEPPTAAGPAPPGRRPARSELIRERVEGRPPEARERDRPGRPH